MQHKINKITLELKPKEKGPTYFSIADLAKCTIATVSRYFNGGYVSDQIRERISAAIDDLDYNINTVAKSMRQTDNVIYLATSQVNNATNFETIQSIDQVINKDCLLFICQTSKDQNTIDKYLTQIKARNPSVLIIFRDNISLKQKALTKFSNPIFYYGHSSQLPPNAVTYYFDESVAFKKIINDMINEGANIIHFVNYNSQSVEFVNAYLQDYRIKVVKKIQTNLKTKNVKFIYTTLKDNSTSTIKV